MACKIVLEIHENFIQTDFDFCNAHTECSRDKAEEELESDIIYHYMLKTFKATYGRDLTCQ